MDSGNPWLDKVSFRFLDWRLPSLSYPCTGIDYHAALAESNVIVRAIDVERSRRLRSGLRICENCNPGPGTGVIGLDDPVLDTR